MHSHMVSNINKGEYLSVKHGNFGHFVTWYQLPNIFLGSVFGAVVSGDKGVIL